MRSLAGSPPHTLLERPVFDAQAHLIGRVGAVGTRHGEVRRIGIESFGPSPSPLRFVAGDRFRIEQDRVVVLAP